MSKSGPPILFFFSPLNIKKNQFVSKKQIFHLKYRNIFFDEKFRDFLLNQPKENYYKEGDFGFIKSNYIHICDIERVYSAHGFCDLLELSETQSIIIKDKKNSGFESYEDETEIYFNSLDSVSN